MEETALVAERIAKKLGLNETVAYIGMLMHDAGHTLGSHEGEQTMNIIGELENIGFFHHSAKGVDVVLSEGIIQSFVDKVPEAKQNKELEKRLKEEAWYFLELIVGHDGEATKSDRNIDTQKKYNSMKEAVLDKVSKANTTNQYKCPVETLEAQISKPADVLAYFKSDMIDAYTQDILKEFSDDYLKLIGETLCETYEETEKINEKLEKSDDNEKKKLEQEIGKERIKKAKKLIREIKIEHIRENPEDIDTESTNELRKIIKKLDENNIDYENISSNEYRAVKNIIDKIIEDYVKEKISQGIDKNTIKAQTRKISDCFIKMQKTRKRVVEDVMDRMKEALIEDYINTTLKNWEKTDADESLTADERYKLKKQQMGFSNKANEIIYGIAGVKALNYRDYVHKAKKEYQTDSMPKALYKMILDCSRVILKTGIIREKFYDNIVVSNIDDQKLINIMHKDDIDTEENDRFKKKVDLKEEQIRIKMPKKQTRYKGKKVKRKIEMNNICKDIYRNIQRQGTRFARNLKDVYCAIPNTVEATVRKAINKDYDENQYLGGEEKKEIQRIKKDLKERFKEKQFDKLSNDELKEYIKDEIEIEKESLEEKMAIFLCRDYIAGMGDNRIKDLVVKLGYVSKRKLDKQDKQSKVKNKNIDILLDKIKKENDKQKKEKQKDEMTR